MSYGLPEELHRRADALVLMHLYKASTRMIVYGHVRKLPTHPAAALAVIAGDAMAYASYAPELFGVDMKQLPGLSTFVAQHREDRIKCLQTGQPRGG